MSKKIRLLAKLMRSGEFSRSAEAEEAVRKGRVTVDGKPATNPQHSVKANATVSINDRPIEPVAFTYVILDKQKGMVCQKTDKERNVYEVISSIEEIDPKTRASLFCVGRLDRDTEGLLIITNDGQLEKLLTKGKRIIKIYAVVTDASVTDDDVAALLKGVQVTDDDTGKAFFVKAVAIKRLGEKQIEIGIDEGRKRQIKKMLEALGNHVVSLRRVGIGKMRIESLNFDGKRYLIARKQDLKF
ncbi:MAG: pseudouridine synthase [Candidatus Aenigmarchaeota archaeon]|nr:pseudouridine synthase [Candidatus Aenigmarchaeota archaeon]